MILTFTISTLHTLTELEKCIEKAECEVIQEQIDLGIDVITDGELRRENYIWYFW